MSAATIEDGGAPASERPRGVQSAARYGPTRSKTAVTFWPCSS